MIRGRSGGCGGGCESLLMGRAGSESRWRFSGYESGERYCLVVVDDITEKRLFVFALSLWLLFVLML